MEDIYFKELVGIVHTYSNGAKSCYFDKIYTSKYIIEKINKDGKVSIGRKNPNGS
jgi:hypothetical protein